MARVKSSLLTEKQDKYVEARMDGKPKMQAAKEAGYSIQPTALESSAEVKRSLLAMREELSSATQISRAEVLGYLKEAYEMSKLMAEPATMVSSAREIGKMLGFYEPETIKVQLSQSQQNFQSKLLTMSDADLLAIAQGKATVIDGECVRVQ